MEKKDNIGNRSNQGKKEKTPEEIKGWNWGAFFLNGFWGLGNRTYFALLAFIPILNIFVMVILGFKGNEMAWKNKEWESIEHFKSVQNNWSRAGLVAFSLYVIIFLINLLKIFFDS